MELFLVLTLLMLSEKNPELKSALQSVVKFYRENRELLLSVSGNLAPAPLPREEPAAPPAQGRTEEPPKSSPLEGEGSLKLIEEFLKRQKL